MDSNVHKLAPNDFQPDHQSLYTTVDQTIPSVLNYSVESSMVSPRAHTGSFLNPNHVLQKPFRRQLKFEPLHKNGTQASAMEKLNQIKTGETSTKKQQMQRS